MSNVALIKEDAIGLYWRPFDINTNNDWCQTGINWNRDFIHLGLCLAHNYLRCEIKFSDMFIARRSHICRDFISLRSFVWRPFVWRPFVCDLIDEYPPGEPLWKQTFRARRIHQIWSATTARVDRVVQHWSRGWETRKLLGMQRPSTHIAFPQVYNGIFSTLRVDYRGSTSTFYTHLTSYMLGPLQEGRQSIS